MLNFRKTSKFTSPRFLYSSHAFYNGSWATAIACWIMPLAFEPIPQAPWYLRSGSRATFDSAENREPKIFSTSSISCTNAAPSASFSILVSATNSFMLAESFDWWQSPLNCFDYSSFRQSSWPQSSPAGLDCTESAGMLGTHCGHYSIRNARNTAVMKSLSRRECCGGSPISVGWLFLHCLSLGSWYYCAGLGLWWLTSTEAISALDDFCSSYVVASHSR